MTFGNFRLDVGRGCLLADGVEIPLRPKTFALLSYLVGNPGRLVSKDELIRAVWRGGMVTDDVLVQSVGELRRALGREGAAFIRTVPRRGYRFEAQVAAAAATGPPETAHPPVSARDVEAALAGAPQPRSTPYPRWRLYGLAFMLLAAVLFVAAWKSFGLQEGGRASERHARVAPMKPAVVVAPFEKPGAVPESQYSGLDPMRELFTALSRFSALTVKPGDSVQRPRDVAPRPATAARDDLDMQYRVEGSVRYAAGRIEVKAWLLDPKGDVSWTFDPDEPLTDEHAVRRQLGIFAAQVAFTIWKSEQRLAVARSPDNLDAYDIVQRAQHALRNGNQKDPRTLIPEVRVQLQHAIELDPDYAGAASLLADTYVASVLGGHAEFAQDQLGKAGNYARRALALNASNVHAQAVMAYVYLLTGRARQAREVADGLLQMNRNDPLGLSIRGTMLVWLGETDAAIETLESVSRITTPLGEFRLGGPDNLALALAYYLKGRYQDAIDTLGPPDPLPAPPVQEVLAAPLALLAACRAQMDDMERAMEAANLVGETDPAMASRMQLYIGRLSSEADRQHLKEGLIKAGLLPDSRTPAR